MASYYKLLSKLVVCRHASGVGNILETDDVIDAAILFMSIHMSLQIFSPTSKIFGRDGLHRFRHTVLGLYLSLPLLSASLAFIRSRQGYILQGPFCTLPIRPYWYRLALTWIPRYLIWAYITFVALRIYMHVGRGFKVFARQEGRISTCDPDLESEDTSGPQDLHVLKKHHELSSEAQSHQNDGASTNLFAEDQLTPMEWSGRRPSNHNLFAENQSTPMEGLGRRPSNHNLFADDQLTPMEGPGRRLSNFNWPPASAGSDGTEPAPGSQSRRGSRVTFQADGTDLLQVPVPTEHQPLGSISSVSSLKSSGDASSDGNRVHALEPIHENRTDNSNDAVDIMSADTPLKKRRRAIQRQLRLLFIYPVVYIIMWTIPFVYHSMNYSNYYAQHPVYALAVLAIFFQTALGSVDSVVFGWREKPWRQIPGSDGSFLGSFMFWRHHKQDSLARISTPSSFRGTANQEMASHGRAASGASRIGYMRSASHSSMKHKKTWSGSSDRITMEAERAAERLAMERAERGRSTPQGRSGSLSTNNNNNNKPPTEWWERRLSQAVLETPTAERDSFGFH